MKATQCSRYSANESGDENNQVTRFKVLLKAIHGLTLPQRSTQYANHEEGYASRNIALCRAWSTLVSSCHPEASKAVSSLYSIAYHRCYTSPPIQLQTIHSEGLHCLILTLDKVLHDLAHASPGFPLLVLGLTLNELGQTVGRERIVCHAVEEIQEWLVLECGRVLMPLVNDIALWCPI